MSTFFENLTIALQEAIDIEKGEIQITKKFDSPAPTYVVVGTEYITTENNRA